MAHKNDAKRAQFEEMIIFQAAEKWDVIKALNISEGTYYQWYNKLDVDKRAEAYKNSPFKAALGVLTALPDQLIMLEQVMTAVRDQAKQKEIDLDEINKKMKTVNETLKTIHSTIVTAKSIHSEINLVSNSVVILRDFLNKLREEMTKREMKKIVKVYAVFQREYWERYSGKSN